MSQRYSPCSYLIILYKIKFGFFSPKNRGQGSKTDPVRVLAQVVVGEDIRKGEGG
jgi:hypothetical protein